MLHAVGQHCMLSTGPTCLCIPCSAFDTVQPVGPGCYQQHPIVCLAPYISMLAEPAQQLCTSMPGTAAAQHTSWHVVFPAPRVQAAVLQTVSHNTLQPSTGPVALHCTVKCLILSISLIVCCWYDSAVPLPSCWEQHLVGTQQTLKWRQGLLAQALCHHGWHAVKKSSQT